MASHQDDVVQSLLRPSETLRCLLDVEQDTAEQDDRRRLIAIVTHRSDTELGSLLVLHTSATPVVVDALPITEHLVVAVAQTGSIDPPSAETDPSTPTESWSAWLLSIRRDLQDTKPLALPVRTRHIQKLKNFTAEYRRLKEIAATTHPVHADFAWIEAYLSLDPPSRRIDLRLRKQPLHTRLSPAIAGQPGDDILDISIVRRDWIEQTAAKQVSSGKVKHLKIRLGTFNVNGKTPSQDLYPWLRGSDPETQAKTDWISPLKPSPYEVSPIPIHEGQRENNNSSKAFEDPDILVLGFQELDLSTEALLYATSMVKEDEWLTAIFAGLGEKRVLYEKLTSRQLVGMLLIVIVKKALVPCFTDVRSCDAGSGIMGFMGNKGATAIRLEFTPEISSDSQSTTYRSTVLTFVNAHLAAFDEMVDRRNYDFQELSTRLAFSPNDLNGSYLLTSFAEHTYNIYESDVLFWMVKFFIMDHGRSLMVYSDLNYRLALPDEDIRELLFSHTSGIDSIDSLLLYDQLRAAIRSNKAFSGFTEHFTAHLPTYRFASGGSASKDRLGYDMKRKPAWTDRILYMTPPDVRVEQLSYRSHPGITMSDHQPVSADFDVSLALIDRLQYENVLTVLHRELVGFEASVRKPHIKIQPMSIDFGVIKYQQAIDREVIVKNGGDTPCVFRFVGIGSDSEFVSPSWLRIKPLVGLLRPGDTASIRLSTYVDNESAAKLNLGLATLECTLILHTALGKDDFITVTGNYRYTCFANTLERLTRLPGPIRSLRSPEELLPAGQAMNAPTEIMRLINWMMTHVSATEDALFEYPAQPDSEARLSHVIRECLDTGDEFPTEDPDGDRRVLVAAFASTLVAFLDSLIEPVVPARLHAQCLQARDKDEAFEVLNAFPHESINVWISLTALLHYIAAKNDSDQASPTKAHRFASIFAPVLLRDDPTGAHPRASAVGKREFLLLFIN